MLTGITPCVVDHAAVVGGGPVATLRANRKYRLNALKTSGHNVNRTISSVIRAVYEVEHNDTFRERNDKGERKLIIE